MAETPTIFAARQPASQQAQLKINTAAASEKDSMARRMF